MTIQTLLVLLISTPLVFGQATSGVIAGTVTDPTGALVPGASVTVTGSDTGLVRRVFTDAAGYYRVGALPTGHYEVRVEHQGFSPGRNILNGPNLKTVDLSIVKSFRVGERRSLQFRAEAFNLLNRANFDLPANAADGEQIFSFIPAAAGAPARFPPTASVGKIFSTAGDSREIQFALKFIF